MKMDSMMMEAKLVRVVDINAKRVIVSVLILVLLVNKIV